MVRLVGRLRLWFLLVCLGERLPGFFVQAVLLETGEVLALRRTAAQGYAIYLLCGSNVLPVALVEAELSLDQAAYWYPLYALRLTPTWDGAAWPTSREFDRLLSR